nr:hypothetical protein [uncultured Desulfobulbus sp.]
MAKTLINSQNISSYLSQGQKSFVVAPTMILTPGVKDLLSRRGIRLSYEARAEQPTKVCPAVNSSSEPSPSGACLSDGVLVQKIVTLLKKEYSLEDPQTIQRITLEVLARLQMEVDGAKKENV